MDTASCLAPTCYSLVFCLLLLLTVSAGSTKTAGAEITADISAEFALCRPGEGGCLRKVPGRGGPSHPFLLRERTRTSVTEAPKTLNRPCTQDEADRMACKNGDVCRRLKDGQLSCVHKRVKRKKHRGHRLPCTPEEKREAACINGYCYALDLGDFRHASCQPWPNAKTTPKPRSHRVACNRAEKQQTACINGYCYALDMGEMRWSFCQCNHVQWEGKRCEVLSVNYILRYRAELKKTAIISGVVIALIIIVVSISVYCSFKRGKKKRAEAAKRASEEAGIGKSEPAKSEPEAEPMVPNGNADSSV